MINIDPISSKTSEKFNAVVPKYFRVEGKKAKVCRNKEKTTAALRYPFEKNDRASSQILFFDRTENTRASSVRIIEINTRVLACAIE